MSTIVSLIPSGTEMICALGCQDQLVGRSHECDYPPDVKQLPMCTEPAIVVEGSSQDIHDQVSISWRTVFLSIGSRLKSCVNSNRTLS